MGLQFHLETTPAAVLEILTHCRAERVPSKSVQSEMAMLGATAERHKAINDRMAQLLSFLTRAAG